MRKIYCTLLLLEIIVPAPTVQIAKAPERKEGMGSYSEPIIRGVTLVNSNRKKTGWQLKQPGL